MIYLNGVSVGAIEEIENTFRENLEFMKSMDLTLLSLNGNSQVASNEEYLKVYKDIIYWVNIHMGVA